MTWPEARNDMAADGRAHGWAPMSFGPVDAWPASLRSTVEFVLAHPLPMALLWGSDLTILCNDDFASLCGRSCPALVGRTADKVWPAFVKRHRATIDEVLDGKAATFDDALDCATRGGEADRAWATFACSPVHDDGDDVAGILVTALDKTGQIRAERALHESGERNRRLFDSVDEGFCVVEMLFDPNGAPADYRFLEVNAAFEQQTGLVDAAGRTVLEMAPGHERHWLDTYGRVALTGMPARFEHEAAALGRWFDVYAFRIDAPEQRHVAALFRDVTERRRAEAALRESEERQAFLLRLSDTLRSLGDGPARQAEAMRVLGKCLAVRRAQFFDTEPGGDHIVACGGYAEGGAPRRGRLRLDDFGPYLKQSYHDGRTFVVSDMAADSRIGTSDLAAYDALDIRACVGVPIVKEGQLVAVLGVSHDRPRRWSVADIRIIEETAERVWAAAERARAEARIGASEQKYRLLFETMGEGFCVVERIPGEPVDFRLIEGNPAFFEQAGRSDLIGMSIRDAFPGELDDALVVYDRVLRTGEPVRFEHTMPTAGYTLELHAFRLADRGQPRVAVLFQDISDRKRAEAARRASEEWQAFLLKLSDALRPLSEPADIQSEAARVLGQHLGVTRSQFYEADAAGEFLESYGGYVDGASPVTERLKLDDFGAYVAEAFRSGTTLAVADVATDPRITADVLQAYDALGFRAFIGIPLVRNGRLVGVLGLHHATPRAWSETDLALAAETAERTWAALEQARAEAALRDGERRLQTLVEGIPQLVWTAVDGGDWTWCSPQWTAYTGQSLADCAGRGWLDALDPEDRDGALASWQEALRQGRLEMKGRLRSAADGSHRWFQTRATPVRDSAGEIVEWLGTTTDIDDLRLMQQRQHLLLGELQHRVRNILTVVRSVFNRTAERSRSFDDLLDHFRGRLDALARTQVIVTQNATGTADLQNLLRDELLSVGVSDDAGVTIDGPDVALPAKAAESIGLALHELTTNALKYGALKIAGARLEVNWTVNLDDRGGSLLDLTWVEQGVPAVPFPPSRGGFGRELIEEALPYQLGAKTELLFHGGGVRCRIVVPLAPEDAGLHVIGGIAA